MKLLLKNHFLNIISFINFKLLMVLDLIDVYRYHSLFSKNHSKVLPITLVLKYISKISKLCDGYYFVINILHMLKNFNSFELKKTP